MDNTRKYPVAGTGLKVLSVEFDTSDLSGVGDKFIYLYFQVPQKNSVHE